MKNKNPLLALLTIMLVTIIVGGILWAVFVGFISLIALCLGIPFSLPHATMAWIAIIMIWRAFRLRKKEK